MAASLLTVHNLHYMNDRMAALRQAPARPPLRALPPCRSPCCGPAAPDPAAPSPRCRTFSTAESRASRGARRPVSGGGVGWAVIQCAAATCARCGVVACAGNEATERPQGIYSSLCFRDALSGRLIVLRSHKASLCRQSELACQFFAEKRVHDRRRVRDFALATLLVLLPR